jgi:glucuronate isomerase
MNVPKALILNDDRLFPANPDVRNIARRLYSQVKKLPIISPHGHTDPEWFAGNAPFENPSALFIEPDHYVYRMLYSQGISLDALGVPRADGIRADVDPRDAWAIFAANMHLFRGTPSSIWLNWVFSVVFGLDVTLGKETAKLYYDTIDAALKTDAFRPRALFDRYNIEVIATTEGALDDLRHHQTIREENARPGGWQGRVVTAYRPDGVVDPEYEGFVDNLADLAELTGEDTGSWHGYLAAHRKRRAFFKDMGATSTDHGHATARTANVSDVEAEALFGRIKGGASGEDADLFRGQMLTEMAKMSIDDGLVMQIHPGSCRNHNAGIFAKYGRDKGADIPTRTDYVHALRPLLDCVGNEPGLSIILFTLDESVYARELAPLAGHYPCLKLGPSWWFHDSPEGMRRFRQQVTETAGFYNTVGFNDDTRAFLSIPARHDVARRMDCTWLAELVADHRMEEDEAAELVVDLAYNLAKKAYKL